MDTDKIARACSMGRMKYDLQTQLPEHIVTEIIEYLRPILPTLRGKQRYNVLKAITIPHTIISTIPEGTSDLFYHPENNTLCIEHDENKSYRYHKDNALWLRAPACNRSEKKKKRESYLGNTKKLFEKLRKKNPHEYPGNLEVPITPFYHLLAFHPHHKIAASTNSYEQKSPLVLIDTNANIINTLQTERVTSFAFNKDGTEIACRIQTPATNCIYLFDLRQFIAIRNVLKTHDTSVYTLEQSRELVKLIDPKKINPKRAAAYLQHITPTTSH